MPVSNTQTDQSIAEQIYKRNLELLNERRRAEELLYNVSEGVFAVDKQSSITIFNNTLERMLSIPEGIAVGKPYDQIIKIESEKGEPIDLKPFFFLPPQKAPILHDVVLKGIPKDFFVNIKFSVIRSETDENLSECLITLSDITKEILLDKAKDDFLSLASHELNTPLSVIKNYLWMLQKNKEETLTEKQLRYATQAYRSTDYLIEMVKDMLNISRMEQGRMQFNLAPGKLLDAVKDSLEGYDLKAQDKGIYLTINSAGIDPDVVAYYDEGKIRECLANLVGNAIKFTTEGGVTVEFEDLGASIKISITDTGVGISNEEVPKLFRKFGKGESSYRKSTSTGGTGLGLYIVKMYVEAMGGQIGYHSEGDFKGSNFWFTVPKHTILHDDR